MILGRIAGRGAPWGGGRGVKLGKIKVLVKMVKKMTEMKNNDFFSKTMPN